MPYALIAEYEIVQKFLDENFPMLYSLDSNQSILVIYNDIVYK